MSPANTIRYIVFKEAACWYAAALEFNIVESGDDPRTVLRELLGAIAGYTTCASKNGLDAGVLNQNTNEEHERLWRSLRSRDSLPTPFTVFARGEVRIG